MSKKKQLSGRPAASLPELQDVHRGRKRPAENANPAPGQSGEQQPRTPGGKLGVIADLLKRPEGATIQQVMDATGWQSHSVRGAVAGALTKKHGLIISSEKADAGRAYRAVVGIDR